VNPDAGVPVASASDLSVGLTDMLINLAADPDAVGRRSGL